MDKKQKQKVYMVLCSCGHFSPALGGCGLICESSRKDAEKVFGFTHPEQSLSDVEIVEMEVKNG